MSNIDHARFMREALEQAAMAGRAGNAAAGAVVVRGDSVVGRGHNLILSNSDPTAHAEVEAVRSATQALGQVNLSGHTLYTTGEPCRMCFAAIMLSGISELVIGRAFNPREYPSWGPWSVEQGATEWKTEIKIVRGVLGDEANRLRYEWLSKPEYREARRRAGDRTLPEPGARQDE